MSEKSKETKQEEIGVRARPLDLNSHIPGLLVWVNNKFSADGSKAYRKLFKLGISDWRVIAYLGVKQQGTSAQISSFLGMNKAAVSRSVQVLKSKNYVVLDEPDGRRVNISLTQAGIELYNEMLDVALTRAEALLMGLTKEERAMAITLLHKMHENMPAVEKTTDELIAASSTTRKNRT